MEQQKLDSMNHCHGLKATYIVMRMEGINIGSSASTHLADLDHYVSNLKASGQFTRCVHKQNCIRYPHWLRTFGKDIALLCILHFTKPVDCDLWLVAEWLQCVDVQLRREKDCKNIYSKAM